jgi:hypothetical protein
LVSEDQWLAPFFICQHHSLPQDWRMQFAGTGSSARDIGADGFDERVTFEECDVYEA